MIGGIGRDEGSPFKGRSGTGWFLSTKLIRFDFFLFFLHCFGFFHCLFHSLFKRWPFSLFFRFFPLVVADKSGKWSASEVGAGCLLFCLILFFFRVMEEFAICYVIFVSEEYYQHRLLARP